MNDKKKVIRRKLDDNNLTRVWLINRLAEEGIMTDRSEFSCILNGARSGPKPDAVIAASLRILEKYEKSMAGDAE